VLLEVLKVYLEMMALVLRTTEGGTFKVCHGLLARKHMLPMVAQISDILRIHQLVLINLLSCGIRQGR
jgi:hypothetical protein